MVWPVLRSGIFLSYILLTTACGALWVSATGAIPCAGTSSNSPYAAGSGNANDPYQICTAAQLNNIGSRPQDWDANFILENNIDLSVYSGTQFNLIGNTTIYFTGTFNGNNLTIANFTYSAAATNNVGLFSAVGGAATIENLTLLNPHISGQQYVGWINWINIEYRNNKYTKLIFYS